MAIDRTFVKAAQISNTEKTVWATFLDTWDSSTTTAASITTGSLTGTASPFPIAGLASTQGGAVTVTGGASSTSANAGGAVTLLGGAPGATGVGGAINITGAAGGATSGAGGALVFAGGAGTNGNAAGGAASFIGGAGQGSAAGGAVTITSGAAGATGVAGVVSISVGAATAGNGSAMTLTAGNGAGGTAAGGSLNLVPGAAVSTGIPGDLQVNGVNGIFEASWNQPLTTTACPAAAAVATVMVANRACRLRAIRVCAETHGTSETFTFTKDASAGTGGAGTAVLTGAVTIASSKVPVSGTLSATIASITFAAGDRLSFTVGGTVGAAAGITVSALFSPA